MGRESADSDEAVAVTIAFVQILYMGSVFSFRPTLVFVSHVVVSVFLPLACLDLFSRRLAHSHQVHIVCWSSLVISQEKGSNKGELNLQR
jgi:hypothetical protein